jgi:hypothetical protein
MDIFHEVYLLLFLTACEDYRDKIRDINKTSAKSVREFLNKFPEKLLLVKAYYLFYFVRKQKKIIK